MGEYRLSFSIFLIAVIMIPAGHFLFEPDPIVQSVAFNGPDKGSAENTHIDELFQGALHFTRNDGQISNTEILYYASGGNMGTGFSRNGMSVVLNEEKKMFSYRIEFIGGHSAGPIGEGEMLQKSNYLIGSGPDSWFIDVPNYERVVFHDVWDCIDIAYRSEEGRLKYDIFVRPGGRTEDIRFGFNGVEPGLSEEALLMITPLGRVIDDAPVSYQDDRKVPSHWYLHPEGYVSIRFDGYDPEKEL
ncbi:MAG: hypothetical protein ACMUFK_04660, partial [Thermoplasmatota archaeon]